MRRTFYITRRPNGTYGLYCPAVNKWARAGDEIYEARNRLEARRFLVRLAHNDETLTV